MTAMKGTTICAVKKDGHIAIAGDGQVTMGEHTIFKGTARKVRRIYNDSVVTGFAGSVADAFTLCERFEDKLTQCGGNLERAAVMLAQEWRGDKGLRQLEAMLIAADKERRKSSLSADMIKDLFAGPGAETDQVAGFLLEVKHVRKKSIAP